MTNPTAEEQARAEAELKGEGWWFTRNGDGDCLVVPPDSPYKVFSGSVGPKALNINTAEGQIAAMELLDMKVGPKLATGWPAVQFTSKPYSGVYGHISPAEAIKAAWYAYVESRKEKWANEIEAGKFGDS